MNNTGTKNGGIMK